MPASKVMLRADLREGKSFRSYFVGGVEGG
jgi:hypothetical protein